MISSEFTANSCLPEEMSRALQLTSFSVCRVELCTSLEDLQETLLWERLVQGTEATLQHSSQNATFSLGGKEVVPPRPTAR